MLEQQRGFCRMPGRPGVSGAGTRDLGNCLERPAELPSPSIRLATIAVAQGSLIKYNFPTCKRVSNAARRSDGSIRAKCDGKDYLVFTIFNPKEGKAIEVAMNCTAAKSHLNIDC